MTLLLLLVALVVAGGAVAVALGRIPGGLDEPTTSRPLRALPEGPLRAEDVDGVRFSLGLRGYRMDEVDAVLDRVRDEVAERDARLAELEALLRSADPVDPPWRDPAAGGGAERGTAEGGAGGRRGEDDGAAAGAAGEEEVR
ncbi:DivIVA domain-containing protein [uncultured Pseudokineococcus sp.]|uniref:DivIVA domain-containing protein n=1 Tax=uncultured Pseudokineococcus sp. TaxID=1642928 RepID=UPI00261C9088|nr:DivIVA domain-containing protein [uncultured Pseudokineococcus sp.]